MKRRQLMLVVGGAAMAEPFSVRAQQKAMPTIGFLGVASPDIPMVALNLKSFWEGLRETGYIEGRNVAVEYRWAEGHYERLPALAAELVRRKVDVIVNEGGTPSAQAARDATSTIPIVFHASDAVADGLVASLARPGGNLTGVSLYGPERDAKLFQLAAELVPRVRVIGLLVNPNASTLEQTLRVAQETTAEMGRPLSILKAGTDQEIDAVFAHFAERRVDVVVIPSDVFLNSHTDQIVQLAMRYALPTLSGQDRRFAVAGGLLGFAASLAAAYRLKGDYTGKILGGAKPADLPVQQPTEFELVLNLKTAKALGLSVPPSILARADEMIE
jgi:putative ABC transport system substrate-binding protein